MRLNPPFLKGILYLVFYYVATRIISSVTGTFSSSAGKSFLDSSTSFLALFGETEMSKHLAVIYLGMFLQAGVVVFPPTIIPRQLTRSVAIVPVSGNSGVS